MIMPFRLKHEKNDILASIDIQRAASGIRRKWKQLSKNSGEKQKMEPENLLIFLRKYFSGKFDSCNKEEADECKEHSHAYLRVDHRGMFSYCKI